MARTKPKKDILLKDWLETDNPILNLYQIKANRNANSQGNKWVVSKYPMNHWRKSAWVDSANGEILIDKSQDKELVNRANEIDKLVAELNKRPLTFWDLITQMFSSNKGK